MGAIGGDVEEITWNHPTRGSGRLYAKAGEDSTSVLGGRTGDNDMQKIDGSGAAIRTMTNGRWKVTAVVAWYMNSAVDELTQMQDLAGDTEESEFTITYSNGTVWAATGFPVDDLEGNSREATFELTISGGGKLVKIGG